MPSYRYLIIGGGMTADAAVHGIRDLDPHGTIGLVSAESDPPYNRPPLSKALWKGDPFDSIWRSTNKVSGVTLHLGRRMAAIDFDAKRVTDDRGAGFGFEKLLLATGASPRRLPFRGENIIYYRTLDDYRKLRTMAEQGASFVVIGGGFIGSEIAAALAMHKRKVTMLFPEEGIGARLFPTDLSAHLVDYYREKGVDVRPGESVSAIASQGSQLRVDTKSGFKVTVDAVVAGVGVMPQTDLAKAAGLLVEDGILVDDHLRTSHDDVWAAGDVARFNSPALGKRIRVEHEDNAVTMGHAAGRAMAGDMTPYTHLPFFYSDMFEMGYEAVGEMDPRGEVIAEWKGKFREGVVYYLAKGRVRGVLLWNIFGQVDNARALIAQPGPFTAESLRSRLPA